MSTRSPDKDKERWTDKNSIKNDRKNFPYKAIYTSTYILSNCINNITLEREIIKIKNQRTTTKTTKYDKIKREAT